MKPQINKLNTATQSLKGLNDLPLKVENRLNPIVTQGKLHIKDKELKAHENEKRLVSEQKENLSQLKANLIEIKSQHDLNLEKEKELAKEKEATDNLIKDNTETMKKCEDLLYHIMTHLTDQSDSSPKIDLESLTKQVDKKIEEKIKKVKEAQPKPNHIEDIFTEDYKWYNLSSSDDKKPLKFHLVNKIQFYHKESLDDMQMITFVSKKDGEDVELDHRCLDIEGRTALMDYIDYLNSEKSS